MSEVIATVRHVEGLQFVARANSGHAVVMDGHKEFGGLESAPSPMELVLMGLGGCSAMDAVSILKKKKQPVQSFEVHLKGIRAEGHPARYTDITLEFVVHGEGVDEKAVQRAVSLSMDKYCSVKATLELQTKVAFTCRVEGAPAGEAPSA